MWDKGSLNWFLLIMLVLGGASARAQKSAGSASEPKILTISTSDLTRPVLKAVQDTEDAVVEIAEDFPDELYNTYRPKKNQDVRTAAEILLHIAETNQSVAQGMRTKEQEEALIAAGKQPSSREILTYVSKPDTIAKVKASFAAVRQAIEDNPDPKKMEHWLSVIEHSSGHYGNLITYYRENGLVPPSSRR